ncbi:MAG: tRNA 2-thiouridine(34) synthase MnmA, partial [Bacteroidetes bacterium]|nr:tRNA 2-thiouridine(34) synthase MnmA [Bacteroidota bacterium]
YKDPGALSTLTNTENGIQVSFHHSVNSIAPGQSAVMYEGDDVLAGGIILRGQ